MSPMAYIAQTGHLLGPCNLLTCTWQGACVTFLPQATLGALPAKSLFQRTAAATFPSTASASIPATMPAPIPSTSSVPPLPLCPPNMTASKSGLKDVLKSFNEATAQRAARRDDGNPRHENTNAANDKKRKASATLNEGRGTDSKLSEVSLALKIALSPSSTPSQINERIRTLFTTVFDNPILFIPPLGSDSTTVTPSPWCLLLGEAAPHLGEKVKILRPTIRKQLVTMDDIDMSMTSLTQYRMEGGGSGWKHLFWIALAPEHPDVVLPSLGEAEFGFTYLPQYSGDEDAKEDCHTEDDKAAESDEDLGGDLEYRGRRSQQENWGSGIFTLVEQISASPPRKSSQVKKPTIPDQRIESDEDDVDPAHHGPPAAADPTPSGPEAPPPRKPSTRQPSRSPPQPHFVNTTSHSPSPGPTPPPPMRDAMCKSSPDSRPTWPVKPVERQTSPGPLSPPRNQKAPIQEQDDASPLRLNWEEILAGVWYDLACLWQDIWNICNPMDETVVNYFPLNRLVDKSGWGSALRAAEDFDTLRLLLQPKIHPIPRDTVLSFAKQLIDFGVHSLYPTLHLLAFGNSSLCFGPYGLHTIIKSTSKLLWAFHAAMPYQTLSILQLSGIIKRLQAAVSTFRSTFPHSQWDPFPFRGLQVMLNNHLLMHHLPLVRYFSPSAYTRGRLTSWSWNKGKSTRGPPVIDSSNLPSPEVLRQTIITYYGTLDDATAFPSQLITAGSEGLETLFSRVVHPFLDARVTLSADELLSEPCGPYEVMWDILGTLCETLATRLEFEIAKAAAYAAKASTEHPPSPATSVYVVSSNDPSPLKSRLQKQTVSINSDSELTPPPQAQPTPPPPPPPPVRGIQNPELKAKGHQKASTAKGAGCGKQRAEGLELEPEPKPPMAGLVRPHTLLSLITIPTTQLTNPKARNRVGTGLRKKLQPHPTINKLDHQLFMPNPAPTQDLLIQKVDCGQSSTLWLLSATGMSCVIEFLNGFPTQH
ncbi:hypothetical protein M407DRAFT_10055, partial [Tulasnella calospora MUT 4182]